MPRCAPVAAVAERHAGTLRCAARADGVEVVCLDAVRRAAPGWPTSRTRLHGRDPAWAPCALVRDHVWAFAHEGSRTVYAMRSIARPSFDPSVRLMLTSTWYRWSVAAVRASSDQRRPMSSIVHSGDP